jgi:preprotein translocase subunit SecA
MFAAMTEAIKEESVGYVFNLDASGRATGGQEGLESGPRTDGLHFSAPTLDTAEGVVEGDFEPADAVPSTVPPAEDVADAKPRSQRRAARSRNRRKRQR